MSDTKKWYALYTKPRWEKKVNKVLQEKGIESYCPLNKVRKKWSDRLKMVEEPLFKSYVFVKVTDEEQLHVRMTNGVLNFIYWNGKPATIKQKEIDTIKRFLNEYEFVEAKPVELVPSQKVIITSGVMMDKEGVIQKIRHNKVEVIIESLGYKLIAVIDRNKLSII